MASKVLKEKGKRRKRWGKNIAEEKNYRRNQFSNQKKNAQFSKEMIFILKSA